MTPTGAVKAGAAGAERQVLPLLIHFLFACSRNFDDFESQFEDHSLRSPLVLSSKSLTAPINFLGLASHVALGTFTEIQGRIYCTTLQSMMNVKLSKQRF